MPNRELESFGLFCKQVASTPDGLTARCNSASAARQLRRRFYRLREQLPEEERQAAANLQAVLVGRYLTIKPASAQPVDWMQLETQDVQPALPSGDRLDHTG